MNVLVYLVPVALALGGLGLAAFLWALKHGQFDDLDGAAWRAISDDDLPEDGGRRSRQAGSPQRHMSGEAQWRKDFRPRYRLSAQRRI